MEPSLPQRAAGGPVGQGEYVVEQGDCLESIAVKSGHSWTTIWDHPENADLKAARKNPNALLPGDRLHIPPLRVRNAGCATEKRHPFRRRGVPSKLRLRVLQAGYPRANERYRLGIDGKTFEGTTDSEGRLEIPIRPQAAAGTLTFEGDPFGEPSLYLDLGSMDPITETVGVQKRLANLGYTCEPTGELDAKTREAIARFQGDHELEATGDPDTATRERLKREYGC